jgi:hypothetical protein
VHNIIVVSFSVSGCSKIVLLCQSLNVINVNCVSSEGAFDFGCTSLNVPPDLLKVWSASYPFISILGIL